MKTIKKLLAVMLAAVMLMGVCVCSSSAASTTAPVFELRVVSQTNKKAVLNLVLTEGGFNSIDITFKISSNISSIASLYTSDDFDNLTKEFKRNGEQVGESSSAVTKKLSLASTALVTKKIAIYELTVNKKNSADLLASDVTATVTECIIDNASVVNSVTVKNIFGKVAIDNKHDITLNYKDGASLTATTTYKDGVKWSSSNTNVATVDANGNITTTGRGTANIIASSPDGSVTDSCQITVNYTWWQWIIVIVLFGWIWY